MTEKEKLLYLPYGLLQKSFFKEKRLISLEDKNKYDEYKAELDEKKEKKEKKQTNAFDEPDKNIFKENYFKATKNGEKPLCEKDTEIAFKNIHDRMGGVKGKFSRFINKMTREKMEMSNNVILKGTSFDRRKFTRHKLGLLNKVEDSFTKVRFKILPRERGQVAELLKDLEGESILLDNIENKRLQEIEDLGKERAKIRGVIPKEEKDLEAMKAIQELTKGNLTEVGAIGRARNFFTREDNAATEAEQLETMGRVIAAKKAGVERSISKLNPLIEENEADVKVSVDGFQRFLQTLPDQNISPHEAIEFLQAFMHGEVEMKSSMFAFKPLSTYKNSKLLKQVNIGLTKLAYSSNPQDKENRKLFIKRIKTFKRQGGREMFRLIQSKISHESYKQRKDELRNIHELTGNDIELPTAFGPPEGKYSRIDSSSDQDENHVFFYRHTDDNKNPVEAEIWVFNSELKTFEKMDTPKSSKNKSGEIEQPYTQFSSFISKFLISERYEPIMKKYIDLEEKGTLNHNEEEKKEFNIVKKRLKILNKEYGFKDVVAISEKKAYEKLHKVDNFSEQLQKMKTKPYQVFESNDKKGTHFMVLNTNENTGAILYTEVCKWSGPKSKNEALHLHMKENQNHWMLSNDVNQYHFLTRNGKTYNPYEQQIREHTAKAFTHFIDGNGGIPQTPDAEATRLKEKSESKKRAYEQKIIDDANDAKAEARRKKEEAHQIEMAKIKYNKI